MNFEEENHTTSSNGQSITLPESEATTSDSAKTKTFRISYKTELQKMTRERNAWRGAFLFAAVIILIIVLSSCKGKAQQEVYSGDFKVEFLFENDGCKVYRFNDGGRYIYFSDCRGKMEHTTTTKSGKSSITHYHETMNN